MGTIAHELLHHCKYTNRGPGPDCDTPSACNYDQSLVQTSRARMKLVEDGCGGFGRQ
jgi:hypothetical protein